MYHLTSDVYIYISAFTIWDLLQLKAKKYRAPVFYRHAKNLISDKMCNNFAKKQLDFVGIVLLARCYNIR